MTPEFALQLLTVYVGASAPASVLQALSVFAELLDNVEAARIARWFETFNAGVAGAAPYQDPLTTRLRAKETADRTHGALALGTAPITTL